jgi:hypothetical protein
MKELPFSTSFIQLPIADVLGTIRPDHLSKTVTKTTLPFTFIDSS